MLDLYDVPSKFVSDVKIYIGNQLTATQGHFTWQKPRGCSMVQIFMLGGGGGGGGGEFDSATNGGAGGGGASGGQSVAVFPAFMLPDRLYVIPGMGGAPGAAPTATTTGGGGGGTAGGVGTASYVFIEPYEPIAGNATANQLPPVANILLTANGGPAGNPGANGGVTTAAAAAAAVVISGCPLAGMGFYKFYAGQGGGAGNNSAAAPVISLPTTGLMVTAGGSGGGFNGTTPLVGGSYTSPKDSSGNPITNLPDVIGGTSSNSLLEANGSHGFNGILSGAGFNIGGAGGYGSGATTTFGGRGGNGGLGCGGGGGAYMLGGGTLPSPAPAAGGRGGDGLVIITCW